MAHQTTTRSTGTEQLISDTAKRIFLAEGRLHATTETIAKEAGIPRTSVHYYFRSRDLLFREVFNEALKDFTDQLKGVVLSDIPFREKLETYVEIFLSQSLAYPYLQTFVITEIINNKYELVDKESPSVFKIFLKEIKEEMTKGAIAEMDPMHFILNLFSLLAYPSVASPLYKKLFLVSDQRYQKLLKERKEIVLSLLLK